MFKQLVGIVRRINLKKALKKIARTIILRNMLDDTIDALESRVIEVKHCGGKKFVRVHTKYNGDL